MSRTDVWGTDGERRAVGLLRRAAATAPASLAVAGGAARHPFAPENEAGTAPDRGRFLRPAGRK